MVASGEAEAEKQKQSYIYGRNEGRRKNGAKEDQKHQPFPFVVI